MSQNPSEVEIEKIIDKNPETEDVATEEENNEINYSQELPAEIVPTFASEKEIASAEEIVSTEEIDANSENLYPGTRYFGSYDNNLTPMGENVISKLGDDDILILNI